MTQWTILNSPKLLSNKFPRVIFHAPKRSFLPSVSIQPSIPPYFGFEQKRNWLLPPHFQYTWLRLQRHGVAYTINPIVPDYVLWSKTDVAFFLFMTWLSIATSIWSAQGEIEHSTSELSKFSRPHYPPRGELKYFGVIECQAQKFPLVPCIKFQA